MLFTNLALSGPAASAEDESDRLAAQASQAEATEIASEDAALEQRLRSILDAVTPVSNIGVAVDAGVVVLGGSVANNDLADQAVQIAEQLDGVLLVVNEIEVEKDLGRRLLATWDTVEERLRTVLGNLPLVLTSLVLFVAFWLLARLLREVDFPYRAFSQRTLLQNLLRQSVYWSVTLIGLVAALRMMDAGAVIGTVLGAAGVVGLALGFAFRNIVENYLAGVLLAIRQPFHAGDLVDIEGSLGTVIRMTPSETTIMDVDGNHIRLPNALVFNGKVINYTRNPLRRFTVAIGVGTEVDLVQAQTLGLQTLRQMRGVEDDPDPSSRVAALGDSSVALELYGWVDQRTANFSKVSSEAHRLIKTCYDNAGIVMPAPTYVVALENQAVGDEVSDIVVNDPAGDSLEIDVTEPDDVADQVKDERARSDEPDLLS